MQQKSSYHAISEIYSAPLHKKTMGILITVSLLQQEMHVKCQMQYKQAERQTLFVIDDVIIVDHKQC